MLTILFGLALTGIIAGGMIAFGIYKYKNWTAEKQRAVARDKEEKRRKEEEKNEAYGKTTPIFQFWDKGESSENYWKSEVNIAHMYVPLREGGGGVNRYSIIPDFRSNGDHSL